MSSGAIISFDNMNDYYDPKLKEYRLSLIEKATENSNVKHVFICGSIADKTLVDKIVRGMMILPSYGKDFFQTAVSSFLHATVTRFLRCPVSTFFRLQ